MRCSIQYQFTCNRRSVSITITHKINLLYREVKQPQWNFKINSSEYTVHSHLIILIDKWWRELLGHSADESNRLPIAISWTISEIVLLSRGLAQRARKNLIPLCDCYPRLGNERIVEANVQFFIVFLQIRCSWKVLTFIQRPL